MQLHAFYNSYHKLNMVIYYILLTLKKVLKECTIVGNANCSCLCILSWEKKYYFTS